MESLNRQNYLDWLRMLAIIGVLVIHSSMIFSAEERWHIKNKDTSQLFTEFNFWFSRFRMPLLFFISGAVTFFIVQKRSTGTFLKMRFHRLIVPLVFGMLILIPPQIYLERVTQGFTGSYLEFYPRVFEARPYPRGDTSWHHLWFILYLFLFNVIGAPLFMWIIKKGKNHHKNPFRFFAKKHRIYLLLLPGVIVYTSLSMRFPQTNTLIRDWGSFTYWFLFLIVGFICSSFAPLCDSLERNRRLSLYLGFIMIVAITYFRWNDQEPWDVLPAWRQDWRTYAHLALFPLTAWFWVFAIIGYGRRYINKPHPILSYVNEAVYPFYILHQTVLVILAYYVVQKGDSVLLKYIFLTLGSFVLSLLIYHLFIRPNNVLRYLFGMSPKKRKSLVVEETLHVGTDTMSRSA